MDNEDVYIKLFYVVVGEGYPLPVVINPKNNTVRELKEVIKAKKMYNFSADELRLFLAKSGEESEWMDRADAAAVKPNEHGELPRYLEEMDPSLPLNDVQCFGDKFQPSRGQIHVLAVLPKVWLGKRGWLDVWTAQSERRGTEPSFIIAENKENLKFAEPYRRTAEKLKNAKEVDEVLEAIALIQAARYPTPFLVLESSSGMGKRQMAFNLMARRTMDVFYFICEAGSEVIQDVYTTFSNRSGSFLRCVGMDLPKVAGASVREIASEDTLYTYGLIWALLSGVDIYQGQRTRADVKLARKEREMCGERDFLFFLDEFPPLAHCSDNRLRFIRNVFRSFDFTVILSSTDETARNPLQSGSGGSRAHAEPRLWCIVQPTFPPFQDPVVDSMCSDLQVIIQHSRPLFATMAVELMNETKTTKDSNTDLVGYLDEMAGNLGKSFTCLKKRSEWFRYGQVRLLLAADFEKRGDSRLVNRHYATLQDDEMFRLSFPPGGRAKFRKIPGAVRENVTLKNHDVELVKNDEEWPWICRSKFPDLSADVLLYLCLMGGKYYQPLVDSRGWPIPFYWAYRIAEAADCALFRPEVQK